mmetsp:Transcript_73697/g.163797  ORF Transcript_73697/g.163797 Transcript_73697/m.163797 type:complete len:433 (-) Transcript_73697:171-1469(-)
MFSLLVVLEELRSRQQRVAEVGSVGKHRPDLALRHTKPVGDGVPRALPWRCGEKTAPFQTGRAVLIERGRVLAHHLTAPQTAAHHKVTPGPSVVCPGAVGVDCPSKIGSLDDQRVVPDAERLHLRREGDECLIDRRHLGSHLVEERAVRVKAVILHIEHLTLLAQKLAGRDGLGDVLKLSTRLGGGEGGRKRWDSVVRIRQPLRCRQRRLKRCAVRLRKHRPPCSPRHVRDRFRIRCGLGELHSALFRVDHVGSDATVKRLGHTAHGVSCGGVGCGWWRGWCRWRGGVAAAHVDAGEDIHHPPEHPARILWVVDRHRDPLLHVMGKYRIRDPPRLLRVLGLGQRLDQRPGANQHDRLARSVQLGKQWEVGVDAKRAANLVILGAIPHMDWVNLILLQRGSLPNPLVLRVARHILISAPLVWNDKVPRIEPAL